MIPNPEGKKIVSVVFVAATSSTVGVAVVVASLSIVVAIPLVVVGNPSWVHLQKLVASDELLKREKKPYEYRKTVKIQ